MTVPEYVPTAVGVMVIVTSHVALAASVALLQLSTEVAMIVGWDSITVPNVSEIEFGLLKIMLVVVDDPRLTVATVTVDGVAIKGGQAIPTRPMKVAPPEVGMVNVAQWLPAAVGM